MANPAPALAFLNTFEHPAQDGVGIASVMTGLYTKYMRKEIAFFSFSGRHLVT
jgi:hypothetical protein